MENSSAENLSTEFSIGRNSSFISDEVASICPLITPSPPTNALIQPLQTPSNDSEEYLIDGQELSNILLHQVQEGQNPELSSDDNAAEEQLLYRGNNSGSYFSAENDNDNNIVAPKLDEQMDIANGENGCTKVTCLMQLTFRNPPENYFFMSWNWPLIRRISLWTFLAGLIAIAALAIALIVALPRKCNPPTKWYQGSVIYTFSHVPKGFHIQAHHIYDLGVTIIRLPPIFQRSTSPSNTNTNEEFLSVPSLVKVSQDYGTIEEFSHFIKTIESYNISVILDIPLGDFVTRLSQGTSNVTYHSVSSLEISSHILSNWHNTNSELVAEALLFWINKGVNGFNLLGLERFIQDPNFETTIQYWKTIVGTNRPLIASDKLLNYIRFEHISPSLDLIDIPLQTANATILLNQLSILQNGTLFTMKNSPWVLWSTSNDHDLYSNNLGWVLFQFMLPGTVSLSPPKGNLNSFESLRSMITLRRNSPAIYVKSVKRDDLIKANAEILFAKDNLVVMQRWYPRRKAFVVVSNFNDFNISTDLSSWLYSGIVIEPKTSKLSQQTSISFKNVHLEARESIVVLLD